MKIEIEVKDIDYEGILELLMPIIGESIKQKNGLLGKFFGKKTQNVAQTIIRKIPPQKRDEWLASIINSNQAKLSREMEKAAANNNINLNITKLRLKP